MRVAPKIRTFESLAECIEGSERFDLLYNLDIGPLVPSMILLHVRKVAVCREKTVPGITDETELEVLTPDRRMGPAHIHRSNVALVLKESKFRNAAAGSFRNVEEQTTMLMRYVHMIDRPANAEPVVERDDWDEFYDGTRDDNAGAISSNFARGDGTAS